MESWRNSMSEFKFACPVCGQHLTAASTGSGTQIECPTCFRKIVVPQAPANGDSKLILAASQAGAPKTSAAAPETGSSKRKSAFGSLVVAVVWAGLLFALVITAYVSRDRLLTWAGLKPNPVLSPTNEIPAPVRFISPYPIPTNTSWTLDLKQAVVPEGPACGRIHGNGFQCENAILTGNALSLRQGQGSPPDLSVGVLLPAKPTEDFSGKTLLVAPSSHAPTPRLIIRWKDEPDQVRKQELSGGYALKVTFGQSAAGRISGRIYVAIPDEAQSFVAGEFQAEIQKLPQHTK